MHAKGKQVLFLIRHLSFRYLIQCTRYVSGIIIIRYVLNQKTGKSNNIVPVVTNVVVEIIFLSIISKAENIVYFFHTILYTKINLLKF